jgi:hypothetical protein
MTNSFDVHFMVGHKIDNEFHADIKDERIRTTAAELHDYLSSKFGSGLLPFKVADLADALAAGFTTLTIHEVESGEWEISLRITDTVVPVSITTVPSMLQ